MMSNGFPWRNSWAVSVVTLLGTILSSSLLASCAEYYGTELGDFREFAHGVRGRVYVVDDDTFFIKGFEYDGLGPDAFFWIGNGPKPAPNGRIVPYPANTGRNPPVLKKAYGEDILLKLPPGEKVSNIDYLSVWCRQFAANFAQILIPRDLEIPRPATIDGFATRRNGVRSARVTIQDDKTLLVSGFSYDGRAPDAFFVAGKGNNPSLSGRDFVVLADERGSFNPLREYRGEDIKLELPRNRSITEFNWISVYSRRDEENLGHITLPERLTVPPAMKLMGGNTPGFQPSGGDTERFTNCVEPFRGMMQVRWKMARDRRSVTIQLMGKIQNGRGSSSEYMSFGLSGTPGRASMIGGDVVVAYYDSVKDSFAIDDYYLGAKSQCDGQRGVCPDTRVGGTDDSEIIGGELVDDVSIVTYRRPVQAGNSRLDAAIPLDDDVTVIAAIGQLSTDNMARYHSKRTDANILIGFGRENQNSCGAPLAEDPSVGGQDPLHPPHEHPQGGGGVRPTIRPSNMPPWTPNVIFGVTRLEAKIGPTGGARGYSAFTGHPSWGIAWWINGQMIPEIYVERGKTYTFVVEGGDNDQNPAESHPFYITSSFEGGFGQKQQYERQNERVFAGVRTSPNGAVEPTARGRLCKYVEPRGSQRNADSYQTLQEYQQSLQVECSRSGVPGQLVWKVEQDTPDEVYYQCFTHKNMGWKIHVRDPGFVYAGQRDSGAAMVNTSLLAIVAALLASLLKLF